MLAVLVAGASHVAAAEEAKPALQIPPADRIFATLHQGHPRLLATREDFVRLKARVAAEPRLQTWYKSVQAEAQGLLSAEPSRYELPDGIRLLSTSRRVVQRTYTLALLYRLDGDRRYADRAWKELEAAAAFKDWNPKHFLDTAEMTHAFAIGYDWLYDVWTPAQRATLQQAMVQKGIKPALQVYDRHNWWARARHNWNQVCNGGIGMGALALAEVEPQLAGVALNHAAQSIQLAMTEFGPDGAWKEGPGYWNYATTYNVVFLAGLKSALGTDFGLSGIEGFSETALFPLYMSGPMGRTFNYADAGDHALHPPQMFWLAREFKQPTAAWFEEQRATPSALDLLWFHSAGVSPKTAGLPLDKYYRVAEVATLRSDWQDPQALFLGFKAGNNKVNHSHLDLGSFVLDAAGVRWACDLGADNYNLPGYFGNQRWNYYRLRAEGHNTLVINPGQKPGQDPAAATQIIRFNSTPNRAYALADLTPAYAGDARRVWRGMAMLDRARVLVQDEVEADKPVELWWFMNTPATIKIDADGKTARLKEGSAELEAQVLSPGNATFQVMAAEPLPTSPNPKGQAVNKNVRKLAIHLSGVQDTRLCVLLTPRQPAGKETNTALKVTPLSKW